MSITINLSPDQERRLFERAAQSGTAPVDYIRHLIDRDLHTPTLDEVLAPFRRQVEESGMSDDELAAFFEEVREDVWREKQAKSGQIP